MDTDDIVTKLQELKEQYEESQAKKARLEGQLEQLLQTLHEDFSCTSVEEGKEKLVVLQNGIQAREAKLSKMVEKLESQIPE